LTVSLSICIHFISSSCLIALARNSSTLLNRSRDSGHPCLAPDYRENGFSFSSLSIMLDAGCRFVIYSFYNVEVDSFYSYFSLSFHHEIVLDLIKGFFGIY
jgi:hypothetical protein